MVKVALEELPPRSLMVMLAVPVLAIRAAGTVAVNCVALTKVVASAVDPHSTLEVAVKFIPLMVSIRSLPPANAEVGASEEIVGGRPAESAKLGDDELIMVDLVESEAGLEVAPED